MPNWINILLKSRKKRENQYNTTKLIELLESYYFHNIDARQSINQKNIDSILEECKLRVVFDEKSGKYVIVS